jgi:hypothetical protein
MLALPEQAFAPEGNISHPTSHHFSCRSPGSPAYAIEATLLAIFLGDMLSSFFVARYERGVLVGNRAQLISIYMRFRFWWDILTVFPWDW